MDRIGVDGWLVAEVNLEHGYYPHDGVDRVFVFRSVDAWSTITLGFTTQFDDNGAEIAGSAEATTSRFESLDDLAAYVQSAYRAGAWARVLDAGHDRDPDLYSRWVPEQMRRDLHSASIVNKDLALVSAYVAGDQLNAPGRVLPDWRAHAVGAMAANLDEQGWHVFHDADFDREVLPNPAEVAGVLCGQRYGYEATIVVRVDDCGEIFARTPAQEDFLRPVVRQVPDNGEPWH